MSFQKVLGRNLVGINLKTQYFTEKKYLDTV